MADLVADLPRILGDDHGRPSAARTPASSGRRADIEIDWGPRSGLIVDDSLANAPDPRRRRARRDGRARSASSSASSRSTAMSCTGCSTRIDHEIAARPRPTWIRAQPSAPEPRPAHREMSTAGSAAAAASRRHDLGDFIRDQRRTARLSLRKLSELAGISNPYLSQIERGLRKPSAEILQAIAKGLRISAETLYVRAGILDERGDGPDLVGEILGDHDRDRAPEAGARRDLPLVPGRDRGRTCPRGGGRRTRDRRVASGPCRFAGLPSSAFTRRRSPSPGPATAAA